MITQISAKLPVDTRRIYIAGFSSGAYMAYYAGCKLSATIAAIGVVSGALAYPGCKPDKPMPLFAVHGTDDPEVSFDEPAPAPLGTVPILAADLPPSVQYWTALNKCTVAAVTTPSANVVRTRFATCSVAEVDFYAITGGTHGWPGGTDDPGDQPPMNELKTSVLMSQFFLRKVR
jgi:polyhydroxybutyrate depolymerase